MKEKIRRLQKDGIYKFDGLSREESKKHAIKLARETMKEDKKWGIESNFGIARDVFGYYMAIQIND